MSEVSVFIWRASSVVDRPEVDSSLEILESRSESWLTSDLRAVSDELCAPAQEDAISATAAKQALLLNITMPASRR
jgi:hypothetical protein